MILHPNVGRREESGRHRAANRLQDAIKVEQAAKGTFEVTNWDPKTQAKIRDALSVLGSMRSGDTGGMFGTAEKVDPIAHLIGSATGWGGNPATAATYRSTHPKTNDGRTVHRLVVGDVPVDGFWSVSVYNARGYFEKNGLDAYSVNSLTAQPGPDGKYTIQFGGCQRATPNCLVIAPGWNYTVRLYKPRKEILDGTWEFPLAMPLQ